MRKFTNESDWKIGYIKSLNYWSQLLTKKKVTSVFFGGGTPSLMNSDTIQDIISKIKDSWKVSKDLEVTLEANPTSVESEKFKNFSKVGINRVSIGIQSLIDKDLKKLGRLHSSLEAKNAYNIARANFERVSFDLIFGRQFQSLKAWELELNEALNMSPDHLSLYQLTIERNTQFEKLLSKGKLQGLPNNRKSISFYKTNQRLCNLAGLKAYEISNYAKPGSESQHNLIYWRGGEYLGIGPGAHGRINRRNSRYRTNAPLNPEKWLSEVENNNIQKFTIKKLSRREIADEYFIMALRLSEGLDVGYYNSLSEIPLDFTTTNKLIELGLIKLDKGKLKTTNRGKLLTDQLIKIFLC